MLRKYHGSDCVHLSNFKCTRVPAESVSTEQYQRTLGASALLTPSAPCNINISVINHMQDTIIWRCPAQKGELGQGACGNPRLRGTRARLVLPFRSDDKCTSL